MSNQIARRRGGGSLWRILLCGVLLTVLVAACLYLHNTAFDFYQTRMEENGSKTIAWLTEQVGFALPFIVICLFQTLVYHKHDPRDGSACREMFWEVVVVAVLTYAVLLPYLASISEALYINALATGEKMPKTDGKVEITLLMELHEWFVRLTIPLGLLMAYHGIRARRETLFPETEAPDAPPITIAEYEARKAAQRTAEALAAQEKAIQEQAAQEQAAQEQAPMKEEEVHEA